MHDLAIVAGVIVYMILGVACWFDECRGGFAGYAIAALFGVPFALAVLVLALAIIALAGCVQLFDEVVK